MTLFLGLLVLTLAVPILAWNPVEAPNTEDATCASDAQNATYTPDTQDAEHASDTVEACIGGPRPSP